jgi:DNA-binding Lrp family transcriptional regulator
MTTPDETALSPPVLLPLAEAASRLGLHPSALRSRIRRGLVTARKGNDGRILVEVAADARPDHGEVAVSPEDELRAELDFMRGQLEDARVVAAKAVAERDAAVATSVAKVEAAERVITELRATLDGVRRELEQARRPLLLRLVDGLRRRS